MNIAFYCQHILGIGHLKRSLNICKNLVQAGHKIDLILGGAPIEVNEKGVNIVQLPGLYMDENFAGLMPCDTSLSLEETKLKRKEMLYDFFLQAKPDVFITELYPLGRKAFRFELDPVLKGMKSGELHPALCCSSVRDILVEKKDGREKFEQRAVDTLNKYFNILLIHSDEKLIKLSETFAAYGQIQIPISYTGFIAPEIPAFAKSSKNESPVVITSIGGGNVGSELLQSVCKTAKLNPNIQFKIFAGRYSKPEFIAELKNGASENVQVLAFSDNFQEEICKADLSISMAGYNTCMNLLRAGTPALLLPFKQNREQELRVNKLSSIAPLTIISDNDLVPENLSNKIRIALKQSKSDIKADLEGAEKSRIAIEECFKQRNISHGL